MHQFLNQKISVNLEEIKGYPNIPYDIYDGKSNLLCKCNTRNSLKLINLLSKQPIFRLVQIDELSQSCNIASKLSKDTTDELISMVKMFVSNSKGLKQIALETFYSVTDHIIDETNKQVHKVVHANEMRIYYDDYHLSHAINVSFLSTILAMRMGYKLDKLRPLTLGALLHDIGMTRIPEEIINKPGSLTPSEYEIIKLHPRIGYKIILDEYMMQNEVALIALQHHERYNASGYPLRLDKDEATIFAQIVAVVDVYDASSSNKSYAPAKTAQVVSKEMLRLSKSFNPEILSNFMALIGCPIP